MLLRQVEGGCKNKWEYIACSLNGVTRQCHLEVFLEAQQSYICIPWSCTNSTDHKFRFVAYSGSPVVVTPLPETEMEIDDVSLVASVREYTLRKLFSELIFCNDSRHIHPIVATEGMQGVLMGTYGGNQSSFYLLGVNGSPDHYLSIRVSEDCIADGPFACAIMGQKRNTFSIKHHDYDIPPMSQQFLLVVAHTGIQNRNGKQKNPSFRYVSTWVKTSPHQVSAKKPAIGESFGSSMKLCIAGQNAITLHCVSSRSLLGNDECRGTIETSFENASLLLGRVSRMQ
jgi:hypothetical protein